MCREAPFSESVAARSRKLTALGFDPLDALPTAFAEAVRARFLVTTDHRLVELGRGTGLTSRSGPGTR